MENPIKMDDLGVPQFFETPISIGNTFSNYWFSGDMLGFPGSIIPNHTVDGSEIRLTTWDL